MELFFLVVGGEKKETGNQETEFGHVKETPSDTVTEVVGDVIPVWS